MSNAVRRLSNSHVVRLAADVVDLARQEQERITTETGVRPDLSKVIAAGLRRGLPLRAPVLALAAPGANRPPPAGNPDDDAGEQGQAHVNPHA
jgi:hypothetical protein